VKGAEIMAANYFNARGCYDKKLVKALVGSTDTIYSSDIGRVLFKSSNRVVLGTGGSSFSTSLMVGFLSQVDGGATGSSGGSTTYVYYTKFNPSKELEVSYTTAYGGGHPSDTDLGSYVGFSTYAAWDGARIDIGNIGNEPGTSDARFLQISGYSTNRGKVYGFAVRDSSVIAW
jgi:hypothetical protein